MLSVLVKSGSSSNASICGLLQEFCSPVMLYVLVKSGFSSNASMFVFLRKSGSPVMLSNLVKSAFSSNTSMFVFLWKEAVGNLPYILSPSFEEGGFIFPSRIHYNFQITLEVFLIRLVPRPQNEI